MEYTKQNLRHPLYVLKVHTNTPHLINIVHFLNPRQNRIFFSLCFLRFFYIYLVFCVAFCFETKEKNLKMCVFVFVCFFCCCFLFVYKIRVHLQNFSSSILYNLLYDLLVCLFYIFNCILFNLQAMDLLNNQLQLTLLGSVRFCEFGVLVCVCGGVRGKGM